MNKEKAFPLLSVLGIWLLLAVFANINGAVRIYLIIPFTGEPIGHVISCFTFSAIIFYTSYIYVGKKRIVENKILISIGVLWFCMTVVFEFVFGHYVMNHPWEKLLNDYNVAAGRLWILVLIATLFSPLLSGKIIKRKNNFMKETLNGK